MKAAIDSGDMNKAAQLNVQLLLSCLMTPDGKRIPAGAPAERRRSAGGARQPDAGRSHRHR